MYFPHSVLKIKPRFHVFYIYRNNICWRSNLPVVEIHLWIRTSRRFGTISHCAHFTERCCWALLRRIYVILWHDFTYYVVSIINLWSQYSINLTNCTSRYICVYVYVFSQYFGWCWILRTASSISPRRITYNISIPSTIHSQSYLESTRWRYCDSIQQLYWYFQIWDVISWTCYFNVTAPYCPIPHRGCIHYRCGGLVQYLLSAFRLMCALVSRGSEKIYIQKFWFS